MCRLPSVVLAIQPAACGGLSALQQVSLHEALAEMLISEARRALRADLLTC
jgi:hypothetical protein